MGKLEENFQAITTVQERGKKRVILGNNRQKEEIKSFF
jgi:hypothetical protein